MILLDEACTRQILKGKYEFEEKNKIGKLYNILIDNNYDMSQIDGEGNSLYW
jgi:hypothetical protein